MNYSTEQQIYECPAANRTNFVLQKALNNPDVVPQSVSDIIEQLQLVQKLNNMEAGIIPDMRAFSDLIRAFDAGNKVNMIKALREMFHTSLIDTCTEINRVFDMDHWRELVINHERVHSDLLMTVSVWEFKGVKLGEMVNGKNGMEWEWNL